MSSEKVLLYGNTYRQLLDFVKQALYLGYILWGPKYIPLITILPEHREE